MPIRFLLAEFAYQPRPTEPNARAVYDFALRSRIASLNAHDRVIFLCDSAATMESLAPVVPSSGGNNPDITYAIVNPARAAEHGDTPRELGWDDPGGWVRCATTDRWARILAALETAAGLGGDGALLMPAHDAVWGEELPEKLSSLSRKYAAKGIGAAVSPYTYWQHSAVPGVLIPEGIIDLINAGFARDHLFWLKLARDQVQGFWGKTSLIPFAMCTPLRDSLESAALEDDLVIDSAIRRLGYGVRAFWAWNPTLYRQALPAFNEEDARRVFARTLHYSLNALTSKSAVGVSTLNQPLDPIGQVRQLISPRFRRANQRAEAIIREEAEIIRQRVIRHHASWVDWGGYRIVVRIGEVDCEVWKRPTFLL